MGSIAEEELLQMVRDFIESDSTSPFSLPSSKPLSHSEQPPYLTLKVCLPSLQLLNVFFFLSYFYSSFLVIFFLLITFNLLFVLIVLIHLPFTFCLGDSSEGHGG